MNTYLILKILFMACVGGIIGYTTNVLAVKMLFRPLEPVRFAGFTIQGLIPKRKNDIATNIGKTIGDELIDYDSLIDNVFREEDKDRLRAYIKARAIKLVDQKTQFIPSIFKGKIMSTVDEVLDEELDQAIDSMSESAKDKIKSRIDIGAMIEDNLNLLDLDELEKLILKISSKELKHIEILGLFLGFAIGLIQGIIAVFI